MYDLSFVSGLLKLYAGKRDYPNFNFYDRDMFYRQTEPIFERQLYKLIESAIIMRVDSYDLKKDAMLPLSEQLMRMTDCIHKLFPSYVQLPKENVMIRKVIDLWINSPLLKIGLGTKSKTNILRVIEELKDFFDEDTLKNLDSTIL